MAHPHKHEGVQGSKAGGGKAGLHSEKGCPALPPPGAVPKENHPHGMERTPSMGQKLDHLAD